MSLFKHPAFPDITHSVPDDRDDEAKAAGWLPVLDDAQTRRFHELEREVAAPCPTCGATGDEPCRTASGKPTRRHKARG